MTQHRSTILLECPVHGVQAETDRPESVFVKPYCRHNAAVQGYWACGAVLRRRRGIVEVLDA